MGTPLNPKYIPYTYMDPLGWLLGTWTPWGNGPRTQLRGVSVYITPIIPVVLFRGLGLGLGFRVYFSTIPR